MTKNKKVIILVICIVVGMIFGSYCTFLALKSGQVSIKNVGGWKLGVLYLR